MLLHTDVKCLVAIAEEVDNSARAVTMFANVRLMRVSLMRTLSDITNSCVDHAVAELCRAIL